MTSWFPTSIDRSPFRGADAAGRRNLLLLTHLRWLAVAGQAVTIAVAHLGFGIRLPLAGMIAVLAALVLLNLVTLGALRRRETGNRTIFLSLLFDVAALSVQLYLSGGAANPFVSLYLLQIVLGALLLEAWSSWALVVIAAALFALVAATAPPLPLPPALAIRLPVPYVAAYWGNFVLSAVLLVLFLARINRNLRSRDAYLAEMRQRAAEEDHIVRMGLLASGAAHELGTPLSSLAVILADWKTSAPIAADPRLAEEVAEMQGEVARCKEIVKGILLASGEVLGDAPMRTTLRSFIREVAAGWDALHPDMLRFTDLLGPDLPIVGDRALAQVIANVLDNALEAEATAITLTAERSPEAMVLTLEDDGTGFPVEMLETLGKPYQSSKGKRGHGLGLFLAVNVLRKLGGTVTARNRERGGRERGGRDEGGATVTLTIPLASLAVETEQ
ncbi:ATP-binding protein [Sphingomonas cannabina]|uniref:ATP-binding protein n=1 Tax=Sphingomonas cannabina TaxID=2899123 RepID=UPI001F1EA8F7|nr:ATP-binding protein [Sphingomonas cannabina]UIJ44340.1 ATP-binding protein [Sphingomonas cannabina]